MNSYFDELGNEWIYSNSVSDITDILLNTYNKNHAISVEVEAVSDVMLDELFMFINDKQLRAIAKYYILGYKKKDIKRQLNINDYLLRKKTDQIRQYVKEYYGW